MKWLPIIDRHRVRNVSEEKALKFNKKGKMIKVAEDACDSKTTRNYSKERDACAAILI